MLLIDRGLDALLAVDSAGTRRLVSGRGVGGADNPFVGPSRLLVMNNVAWVLDRAYDDLIQVDLTTGQRRLVNPFPDEDLGRAQDMLHDASRGRILLLLWVGDVVRILSVDTASEAGNTISGPEVGAGSPLFRSRSFVLDTIRDQLVVFQDHPGRPYVVDPVAGDRMRLMLTEESDALLQDWDFQIDAVFDERGSDIYIANNRFFRIDRLRVETGEWITGFGIPQPRVLRVLLDA